MFFIIPCIDNFVKVDLRTVTFDIPPQEVSVPDVTIIKHVLVLSKLTVVYVSNISEEYNIESLLTYRTL